jgi:hypothetical protein
MESKMKRKMTITITGKDGSDSANVSVVFDPAVSDDTPSSGFSTLASRALRSVSQWSKGDDVEKVSTDKSEDDE